jgi:hypothetical protein
MNWASFPHLDRHPSASEISTRAITRAISHAGRTVSSSVYVARPAELRSASSSRACESRATSARNASTARRYLADWSRRTQWPAPGTATVWTRSLCTASCRGAIGESGGTSGLQAAHASISALLQELSRSIRATCPAWRAIASMKSSFSATNPGRACDSRLAGPGPRARAHRPCPAGQPQHAAPGGHPASARRARPAHAGRPRQ